MVEEGVEYNSTRGCSNEDRGIRSVSPSSSLVSLDCIFVVFFVANMPVSPSIHFCIIGLYLWCILCAVLYSQLTLLLVLNDEICSGLGVIL